MSEEEKEAIGYLKKFIKWETFGERSLKSDVKTVLNYIDKLLEENEALKEKLHEKNMQIIKLNELLAEGIDMSNEENSNQPKI